MGDIRLSAWGKGDQARENKITKLIYLNIMVPEIKYKVRWMSIAADVYLAWCTYGQ